MSDAFTTYRAKRDKRANDRRNARRNARIAAFIGDGMAILSTLILIAALCALAGALASERNAPSYALVVTDDAGEAWVMDYAMSYDDCANAIHDALALWPRVVCEAAKG